MIDLGEEIIGMSEEKTERTEGKELPEKDNSASTIYKIFYTLFSGLVGLILRIKVIGRENEPAKGGFVVCANHTSGTDPIVICYAFRKHQVRFMAKKELFKIPILAQLVSVLGAFPVDRAGNDVGAIKKAVNMVKEGKCMGIFPQGHRYPEVDPRTTETKNGAALITVKSEADVIPAYIVRKNNANKLFRRTWLVIGEPIPFESFNYDAEGAGEYARISEIIFDRICTLGEQFPEERLKQLYKEQKKAEKMKKRSGRA